VLGFYLLIAMGPNGPGGWLASFWNARTIAFSFEGLVLGSVIYSLPFFVQPLRNAFEAIGNDTLEAAASLGSPRSETFFRVEVPLARPGYLTGAVLAFAHTVGEFGVVLMIGGNIPGETNVLSVTIFNFVERGLYGQAHVLSLAMVVFAFAAISATMLIDRRLSRIG
jgi:molybdate transport system permease protein